MRRIDIIAGVKNMKVLSYDETHTIIEGEEYKLCPVCNKWLPATEDYFYKCNTNKEGLYSYCIECTKQKSIKWRKGNYAKYLESMKKTNSKPKRKEFNLEVSKNRREEGKQKEWQQANPEKVQKYNERYSNKKHNITNQEWGSCKDYFKDAEGRLCCAYCGMTEDEHKMKYKQQLHKEHVDCNGEGNLQNCIPACKRCNDSKHTENMEEWYKRQNFYDELKLTKIKKWVTEDYEQFIINIREKNIS